jgi:hypothetical protein
MEAHCGEKAARAEFRAALIATPLLSRPVKVRILKQ